MAFSRHEFKKLRNHDMIDNLYDYGRNFPKILFQAQEDECTFKHVIYLVLTSCTDKNMGKAINYIYQWKNQWESFLIVTIPSYLFKITANKCSIECAVLVKSVFLLLQCFQVESAPFCKIASQLLPYLDVALSHLCKMIPENMNDLKNVMKDLKEQFFKNALTDLEKVSITNLRLSAMQLPIDLSDFRHLSVIPSSKDMHEETPLLQPSIIDGNYDNVEHYLSLCFRLNREDLMYGLRKGVIEYKTKLGKNGKSNVKEYVNVYKFIKLCKEPRYNFRGKLYEVEVKMPQDVEWEKTKRMKCGNLLCFSRDHFQTMTFVSIVKRLPLEGKGNQCYISVKIETGNSKQDLVYDEDYVILEPQNYFEAYRHGLQVLKGLSEDNFPFSKYIVKPKEYTLKHSHSPCHIKSFNGLDKKQNEAVKLAISSPISLIQGPPGTGKTHVALKIVEHFLHNSKDYPIVVICYTNHALDKFLKGVLSFTKKVIRMGNQSESEVLKPHALNTILYSIEVLNIKRNKKIHSFTEKISLELQNAFSIAQKIMSKEFPYNETKKLKHILLELEKELNERVSLLHVTNHHLFSRVVLENMLSKAFKNSLMDELKSSDIVSAVREWLHCVNSDSSGLIDNLRFTSSVLAGKKDHYMGTVCNAEDSCTSKFVLKSNNPWELPGSQRIHRFGLYRNRFLTKLSSEIQALEDFHDILTNHISQTENVYKYNYLKNAHVIGFTTTGAARSSMLLKLLKPKIIIVEEAAEIQEMHVVTSIPNSVEHLILVGDQEQLKPVPACFHLGKHYNLNISLFERLFKNEIPSVTLETQRRMRTSICRLLAPSIYQILINHPTVTMYKDIRGIKSNVFFINHMEPEETCITEKTHMNFHEATFVVALTYYLVHLKMYEANKITILALYRGQEKLLKNIFEFMSLEDVKITTVDGFQGEENHIIIVSFVRSNDENTIGFLNSSNRVCVALSRAMSGLYCIGNFELYSKKEIFWENLVHNLKKEEYGEKMPLDIGNDNIVNVSKVKDFIKTCSGAENDCENARNAHFFSKLSATTISDVLQDL